MCATSNWTLSPRRIEVSKTLSANQDADAIGGSVNLVTKTAGDSPSYSFSGIGGYTPIQSGRWLDSFDGSIGQRFGESKKFGILFGGSYDWNGRGIDDLEPGQGVYTFPAGDPNAGKSIPWINGGIDTRTYQYYRTRYGFQTGLDYRVSPSSTLYVKGLYSDFLDFGDVWVYTYNPGVPTGLPVNGITPTDNTGSMQYREYIRRPDQQIWSFSAGGRHDLTKTLLTYDVAVSRSHQYGGFPTTKFNNVSPANNNITFNQDTTNPYIPKLTPVTTIPGNGSGIYDPTQYALSSQQNIDERTAELSLQGSATLAQRYNLGSHLGTFETGFLIRNSDKYNAFNDPYCDQNLPNLLLSQVLGTTTNPNYYNNSLQMGPMSSYDQISSQFNCTANSPSYDPNTSHLNNDGANYNGTERIISGYLMNSLSVGNSRFQVGVRFESTNESYNANKVQLNPDGSYNTTLPVSGGGSYVNVLPSVQWQYELTPNSNIRASYAMAISRPNFSDLVPSVIFSPNGSPPTASIGNPSSQRTRMILTYCLSTSSSRWASCKQAFSIKTCPTRFTTRPRRERAFTPAIRCSNPSMAQARTSLGSRRLGNRGSLSCQGS
jgi:TonB-dependent receptor